MNTTLRGQRLLIVVCLMVAAGVAATARSNAQVWSRKGTMDVFGSGQYLKAGKTEFSRFGVTLDIDDTGLGGLSMGYHFSDHFSLNFEILLGESDFTASGPGPNLMGDTFIGVGKLNLDYNILRTRFTPVITGGVGFFTFSNPIEDADPVLVCYYDGWWGYSCGYEQPTYYETDFSGNLGAGFRWDVTDHLFLKAIAGATWVKLQDADDYTPFYAVTLSIGGSF